MKNKLARFVEAVKSLQEGQLLQKSFADNLTANTSETFQFKVPTGRGDGYGFSVSFTGSIANLLPVTFTVSINGKAVNIDQPAIAYAINTRQEENTAGTSRLPKTMVLLPEGAIIDILVNTGALGVIGSSIIFNAFFTKKFLPMDTEFNLVQFFQHTVSAGSFGKKTFILPTARGRVVGISLITNNLEDDIDAFDSEATLSINGVELLEDYSPIEYLFTQNFMNINNWVVNIEGGAAMQSEMNNQNSNDINLGFFIFFNEALAPKRERGIRKHTESLVSKPSQAVEEGEAGRR